MDEKIERLYLALRSIREVDQLLIRVDDRSQLLQAICDTLIRNRSYYNAWIVLLDESGRTLDIAEAGLGDGFRPMHDRLDRGDLTVCARRALGRVDVVVTHDPYEDCTDCPLSGMYSGRSSMTVRLEHEAKVFGLLCVSIPREFTHNEEEFELLQEIAGDIAFYLSKMALEEALQKTRRRFRDLVENSPTGILIVQDGVVIYQNPEQERITGAHYRMNEAFEFTNVHPEDVERVKTLFAEISSGSRETIDTDFRFYVPGQTHNRAVMRSVYWRASAIEYRGRRAVLTNMIDITRAKELEQLVLVEDKMTSLGHIAAGIAHEVRNPLSGINIYLKTLEDLLDESEQSEMVSKIFHQIQSASRKIESIVKRVIDFSRPGEPKLVLADINKPIEDALELSSVTMRKTGVKIEKSLADNLPHCRIDPTLIEEVVLNLITNAAEAMKNEEGEKRIEILSSAENNHVFVRVADSGPGIPPELQARVLEPFYTTKKGGSGIGLSLCHRIITDHGGSLTVGKSQWSGAEFVIKLPVERRE